jgi:hypothetical protein
VPARAHTKRFLAGAPALLLLLVLLVAGCSQYHHPYRLGKHAAQHAQGFDLHFIESDDEGWFWDPTQADGALSSIRQSAAVGDTIVVLFVHGWHHSACCCDGNLEGFKEVLRRLNGELLQPMYQGARVRAQTERNQPHTQGEGQGEGRAQRPVKVIGIYAAWRGRSLPGLLDYATFWGRKSAARRVGGNDFQEFIVRLQQVYDSRRPGAPFLGLVSVGHSFGGAALLAATAGHIESELQKATSTPVFLRSAEPAPQPLPTAPPLRGFGDLVVLVNPAVEAAAYERMNLLSRGLRYSPGQSPMLITFSADNDVPRHRLFEWGRTAGEWFTAAPRFGDERERSLRRQALGVQGDNGEQVTHRLEPVDESVLLDHAERTSVPEAVCLTEYATCTFDWYRWRVPPARPGPDSLDSGNASDGQLRTLHGYDFAQPVTFANLRLRPNRPQATPYQPLIVASVDTRVIDGHNGMFSEPFMDFLIRYVGFIEAKQYLHDMAR